MSKKNKTFTGSNKINDKKAAVLGRQRNRRPLFMVILAAVLLIGGGLGAYFGLLETGPSPKAAVAAASQNDQADVISYPVDLFEDGKARHFKYTADGITIRYFILKSSDGVLRAAFDACDVCWRAGKGYYQRGGDMVCRNCGRSFDSTRINEVKGGCNPAPLERTVRDGELIIAVEDILAGKRYFNFNER